MTVLEIMEITANNYRLVAYVDDIPQTIGEFSTYEEAEAEMDKYLY